MKINFFMVAAFLFFGLFFLNQKGYSLSFLSGPISSKDPLRPCNMALAEILSAPNKWKFKCTRYSEISTRGLTYRIDFVIQSAEFQSMTVEEAEKMYAEVFVDCLRKMNGIKIIRPFLYEFPLNPNQLDVTMSFRDSEGKLLLSPNIAAVDNWPGNIVQFSQSGGAVLGKQNPPFTVLIKKSIQEIPLICEMISCKIPRTFSEKKPQVPACTRPKWECNDVYEAVRSCGERLCEKNGLIYVIDGYVDEKNRQWPFGYVLRGSQKLGLDDAKKMATESVRFILTTFEKSKAIVNCLKERSASCVKGQECLVPDLRHVSFRFSFWDEDMNRREAPYIAEVRCIDGMLRYYTADDGQRLVLVHEESCGDAVKSLEEAGCK